MEWDIDHFDVRADGGRSGSFPEKPGCRLLCGIAAEAERLGRAAATTGDHERRRHYLRKMLVQGAHYRLGYTCRTRIRRWGLKLAQRGGKNAKKRAMVAVARKLGILLHRLWVSGEVYEPLRNSNARQASSKREAA